MMAEIREDGENESGKYDQAAIYPPRCPRQLESIL